jgi:glycosyltransferase involved in cell wall biosynthesis
MLQPSYDILNNLQSLPTGKAEKMSLSTQSIPQLNLGVFLNTDIIAFMHTKSPFFSVIVPTYNEEDYIANCIKSLLNQDIDKNSYEVIVIDNASTDKTAKIVKNFPVKLVFEKERSVVKARQKGVDESRGKIIVSADSDTIYPKHWLSSLSDCLKGNPNLIGIVGWIYFKNTSFFFNLGFALIQELNALIKNLSGKFPMVYAANFAFKKSALVQIGGYPTHLPELGDQQYLLFKFQKMGPVAINKSTYCITSSRRHTNLLKDILIYNGYYRIFGYLLNRAIGKQIIGPAPAIRNGVEN